MPVHEIFGSALAALVGPVQNMFFLALHYFNSFVPISSMPGRQPGWVAFLYYVSQILAVKLAKFFSGPYFNFFMRTVALF